MIYLVGWLLLPFLVCTAAQVSLSCGPCDRLSGGYFKIMICFEVIIKVFGSFVLPFVFSIMKNFGPHNRLHSSCFKIMICFEVIIKVFGSLLLPCMFPIMRNAILIF